MIPPRKVKIPQRKSNVDLVVNCSRCGHGKIFKGVAGVDYTNITNRTALLNEAGWQNMPRVLCRSCGCPMDADEILHWSDILRRVEINGNDGADVYDAQDFEKSMREKYGWRVERFFATTE